MCRAARSVGRGSRNPATFCVCAFAAREKEESIEIHLGELHEKFFQVAEMSNADERARRLRDGILHGTTEPVTARSH